jgi:hypothetical protein
MNKINFKKLLPGFVSIIIVAGMALQSFATDIDLSAFVDLDKHMTKYYELDWRVDEIENRLERMYKYVCTNVKTFGGSATNSSGSMYPDQIIMYGPNSANSYYSWVNYIYADVGPDKTLRVNKPVPVNSGIASPSKKRDFVITIPASLCKWRDGIIPAPSCKVYITVSRTGAGYSSVASRYAEVVMGPFKKFPHITGTGGAYSGGMICELPYNFNQDATAYAANSLYYARNTETRPTSWTAMSGAIARGYTIKGYSSTYTRFPMVRSADLENNLYSDSVNFQSSYFCVSTVFGTNLSSYENVWIRLYDASNNTENRWRMLDPYRYTQTTWNYNKE